jgi:hypothetical protein
MIQSVHGLKFCASKKAIIQYEKGIITGGNNGDINTKKDKKICLKNIIYLI